MVTGVGSNWTGRRVLVWQALVVVLLWIAAPRSHVLAHGRRTMPDDPGIVLPDPSPVREQWGGGLRVEWVGLRGLVGFPGVSEDDSFMPLAGGELRFLTLRWPSFYWEILRGGVLTVFYGTWGTAIGYPYDIDDQGRHQLRLGVHLTFFSYCFPYLSGVQIYYLYRATRTVSLEVGVSTLGIFGALVTVGVAFGNR